MQVVAADHGAGLEAQRVDAAAVAQAVHDVVDMVVLDRVLFAGSRFGVPLPAHRDAAVGQAVDQVVGDHGLLGKADPDADRSVVLDAADVDVVVADPVAFGHFGFALRAAQHDPVSADIGDLVALDQIVVTAGYQFDATAAQTRQHAVFEAGLLDVLPANRSRHTAPVPRPFRAGRAMAGLDSHVSARGQADSRMLETQAAEVQVPHGPVWQALDLDEAFGHRRDHFGCLHVLAG